MLFNHQCRINSIKYFNIFNRKKSFFHFFSRLRSDDGFGERKSLFYVTLRRYYDTQKSRISQPYFFFFFQNIDSKPKFRLGGAQPIDFSTLPLSSVLPSASSILDQPSRGFQGKIPFPLLHSASPPQPRQRRKNTQPVHHNRFSGFKSTLKLL